MRPNTLKTLLILAMATLSCTACDLDRAGQHFVMASNSVGADGAAAVWIVDEANVRVLFCVQSTPKSSGEDLTKFTCRASKM